MHKVGLPDPFRSPLNASSLKISFVAMSHNLRCNTNHSSSLALTSYTRGIAEFGAESASALALESIPRVRKKPSAATEEAFRFSGKNFPNLGRSLPLCGGDAPQTHFGKTFRSSASILKTRTVGIRRKQFHFDGAALLELYNNIR